MVGTSTRARLTRISLASSHLEISSTRVLDPAVPSAQLLPFPAVLFLPDPFWAPAVPAGAGDDAGAAASAAAALGRLSWAWAALHRDENFVL